MDRPFPSSLVTARRFAVKRSNYRTRTQRRTFRTRTFSRWSRKAGLPDRTLCAARVLVATKLADRWFFLFGFAKNERGTIDERELATLQISAEVLLEVDLRSLERAIEAGELTEICDEEEPHTG